MGDDGHHDDLTATMQQMQKLMLQMLQTIQAQQLAALLAEQQQQQEQVALIGQRNLSYNFPNMCSAIALPPFAQQDFEIKPDVITLVQRKIFSELPAEIPMEYIEGF